MSDGYIYLAAPYSEGGADDALMLKRFWQITATAAALSEVGFNVFSPITAGRPMEKCGLKKGHDWWMERDYLYLDYAEALFVLKLPGWDTSKGVRMERGYAEKIDTPEFLVEPDYDGIARRVGHRIAVSLDDR